MPCGVREWRARESRGVRRLAPSLHSSVWRAGAEGYAPQACARLWFCCGEFLDVQFALAAEVDDLAAGEEGPVGDDSCGGGELDKFWIADGVCLGATDGCDESGR